METCHLCGRRTRAEAAAEARWLDERVVRRIARAHPTWTLADGACPACVQEAVLEDLLVHGRAALEGRVQAVWPLDAEAAFGALPTPLRMRADPRFTGKGTTIALVDAGFFPHPDLVRPINRVRAWADATGELVAYRSFSAEDVPAWPDMRLGESAGRSHGLMTSVTAAGNGHLSHGLYRGIAPDSSVVLVQVGTARGIASAAIARALSWILDQREALDIGVVSLSIGGDESHDQAADAIDDAVSRLVQEGVSVVAAAGNDGVRRLVPPATSAAAITVGGLDDGNVLTPEARQLWHSNYGQTWDRAPKPEVVAPSMWTVAPVLPGTDLATEAHDLFAARAATRTPSNDDRIARLRLVTPHYQHVDGTSFAAPLVAATIACMRQANPALTPARIKELLMRSATPIAGVPDERQGAGAIDTGLAVAHALGAAHGLIQPVPILDGHSVRFVLHDRTAQSVSVLGSWDGWRVPGAPAARRTAGVWEAALARPTRSGCYSYKFLIDGERWLPDPANPLRTVSDEGHVNSVFEL
jgi:serine protease AprX